MEWDNIIQTKKKSNAKVEKFLTDGKLDAGATKVRNCNLFYAMMWCISPYEQ